GTAPWSAARRRCPLANAPARGSGAGAPCRAPAADRTRGRAGPWATAGFRRYSGCQAAAQVQVLDGDARGIELFDQVEQFFQCVEIRADIRELRADVAVDPYDFQPWQRSRQAIGVQRRFDRDAELVFLQ